MARVCKSNFQNLSNPQEISYFKLPSHLIWISVCLFQLSICILSPTRNISSK